MDASTNYGSIEELFYNTNKLNITGAETVSIPTGIRFFPDWETYNECKISFTLEKNEEYHTSKDTNYTIIITPGDIDYTSRSNFRYFWKIRRCL